MDKREIVDICGFVSCLYLRDVIAPVRNKFGSVNSAFSAVNFKCDKFKVTIVGRSENGKAFNQEGTRNEKIKEIA